MRTRVTKIATPVLIAGTVGAIMWVNAGSLTPPPGAIMPTMKTLTEVEPRIAVNSTNTPVSGNSLYTISQPGSYYLTGDLIGVADKHGIRIASYDVTLDLMGFSVQNLAGVPALDGISASNFSNLAIVNGTVDGWTGGDGIDAGTFNNVRLDGVLARNNGVGLKVGRNSIVTNCTAEANAIGGIVTGDGSTVSGCTVRASVTGITVGVACTVTSCTARNNDDGGILTGDGSTVSGCTVASNIGQSGTGISTGAGCTVVNCASTSNGGTGILAGNGNTITNCSADQNGIDGIVASNGSTITNCSAHGNGSDGIQVQNDCTVRGNTCFNNGNAGDGAGIHATSDSNRIEGNNVTCATRGIDVDAAGNLIIRNSAEGNTTNYDIVADNRYGPVINITAAGTAAVMGNSAASTVSSTDPWANFSF